MMATKKVLVGMSGGVDSSVCAALLKEQGYEVHGATLRLWKEVEYQDSLGCGSYADIDDAKAVCKTLNIPHHILPYEEEFYKCVVDYFIDSYEDGKTPNPCVQCNKTVKFPCLFNFAKENNFDYIATGHYGTIDFNVDSNRYILKKSHFDEKDQSYVLYSLTQEILSRLLLPLAPYTKDEIRQMAHKFNLNIANKADSQDICFIKDGDYVSFIKRQRSKTYPPGDFVDKCGNKIGTHNGIINYTIGQRKGIGAFGKPMFILSINPSANSIILGQKGDEFMSELVCSNVNFIAINSLTSPIDCVSKVRYKSKPAKCTLTPLENNKIKVTFDEPQRAITTGQSIVFYDDDIVLGGGIIE